MFEIKLRRGKISWDFIYIWFGVAISIVGSIVSLIEITVWIKLSVYITLIIFLSYIFLFSGKFQNKLIGMKTKIEDKFNTVVKQ